MNKQEKQWVESVKMFSREQVEDKLKQDNVSEGKAKELIKYYDKLNSIPEPPIKSKKNKEKKTPKQKGFFDKFFNKERMQKGKKVGIVYLRDNGLADFKEVEARDEEFIVEGKPYHVERDCIYTTQKHRIPLAIIREWDLIPLGTKKWYDTEGKDEKMREKFAQLERHVLRGIKNFELWKVQDKSSAQNVNVKKAILYAIIAFVIGAVVIGFL